MFTVVLTQTTICLPLFQDQVRSPDDSLAQKIATAFVTRTRQNTASIGLHNFGHNLAAFLSDGGWYMAAESVLVAIKEDIDEALLAQIDEMGTTYNLCQRLKLETCKFHDEKIF